jgi:peroxiredoxin
MRKTFAMGVAAVLMLVPELTGAQTKTVRATLLPIAARTLAADFGLDDASGKTLRLSDLRGRVVLLDFWATKCGGCVEEMPIFIELAASHRQRGLRVLGVSEDIIYEDLAGAEPAWGQVRRFVRDHKVGYPVVVDDREVHRRYNITALPVTYLLDAKRRIAAVYTGVVNRANLEANINTLLLERQ